MKVAPYNSCIACFRGDTTTVLALKGGAEWIIAAMHKAAGLSLEEASATFHVIAEQEIGCDPGMVPVGRLDFAVRLCRDCAAKTGATVAELADFKTGAAVAGYVQPLEEGSSDA